LAGKFILVTSLSRLRLPLFVPEIVVGTGNQPPQLPFLPQMIYRFLATGRILAQFSSARKIVKDFIKQRCLVRKAAEIDNRPLTGSQFESGLEQHPSWSQCSSPDCRHGDHRNFSSLEALTAAVML
jgi:hypothetical protein